MASDWHRMGCIDNGLELDWQQIGAKAVGIGSHPAMYWLQVDIGLPMDWHLIDIELAMDWLWIGHRSTLDWH